MNFKDLSLEDLIEGLIKNYTPCSDKGFLGLKLIGSDESKYIDPAYYPRTFLLAICHKLKERRNNLNQPLTLDDIEDCSEYEPEESRY